MVTDKCGNNCRWCCNKQYDIENIPVVSFEELKEVTEICITGGQPFRYAEALAVFLSSLKKSCPKLKRLYIYLNGAELDSPYNSMLNPIRAIGEVLGHGGYESVGLTISPRNKKDWETVGKYADDIRDFPIYNPNGNILPSNVLYNFSRKDARKALEIFSPSDILFMDRKWQENFVPAPNTYFRRLTIFINQ